MAKRRPIHTTPLLVASTGLAVALGCGGGSILPHDSPPVGNLMAPPMVSGEVCVDVTPADAKVIIEGVETTDRCTSVETYGSFTIEVSAPGYAIETQVHGVEPEVELSITLNAIREPVPRPVGNLMAPPPIEPSIPREK